MGWSFSGRCYSDSAAVLSAFNLQYPMVDGASANYLESSSITGTPPVITYSVQSRQWASDTVASRTGSLTLQPCGNQSDVQLLPDYSVALLVGICLMFGLGFIAAR
jgi:hypothetical protein